MDTISPVIIGKLIEAHKAGNDYKFNEYARLVSLKYKRAGEERAHRIIQSRIDGTYIGDPKVVID